LTEFFRKTRGLYPDYFLQADQIFVSGEHCDHAVDTSSHYHRAFHGLTRRIPISIAGVSIVRTDKGKIADCADYYDGLTARRTTLAVNFTEWIEY
jgi:hypothetical protein